MLENAKIMLNRIFVQTFRGVLFLRLAPHFKHFEESNFWPKIATSAKIKILGKNLNSKNFASINICEAVDTKFFAKSTKICEIWGKFLILKGVKRAAVICIVVVLYRDLSIFFFFMFQFYVSILCISNIVLQVFSSPPHFKREEALGSKLVYIYIYIYNEILKYQVLSFYKKSTQEIIEQNIYVKMKKFN